jgi:type II secretory pathway pseudopilin PulG
MGVDRMEIDLRVTTVGAPHADEQSEQVAAVTDDSGFGLVEIVVSMFLIGVLAISFLPVLVRSLTASALNITVATSTQMINEQMDTARAQVSNCDQLAAFVADTPPAVTDSQNVVLQATRSAGACSDGALSAASLAITVTRNDTDAIVATATTLVSVEAESEPEDGS